MQKSRGVVFLGNFKDTQLEARFYELNGTNQD